MVVNGGNRGFFIQLTLLSKYSLVHFRKILYVLYNDNVLTLGEYLSILYLNGGVLYGNN